MPDSSPPHIKLDDFLCRLSEWDVLNLPSGSGDDGPYWQGEIRHAQEDLRGLVEQLETLQRERDQRWPDDWVQARANELVEQQFQIQELKEQLEAAQKKADDNLDLAITRGNRLEDVQEQKEATEHQADVMREVLTRLRQWDVLNLPPGSGDDGPYWRGEIDRALSYPAKERP